MISIQKFGLAGAVTLFATGAFAQVITPEIEPNETKAQATANGVVVMVAGDILLGTSTGSSTTTPGAASADTWHVKTGPLAPGIYRHTLAITTTGTAGHTGSIRGLNQTSAGPGFPGVIGTTDATFQSSSSSSPIPRSNAWYGFGRGEEVYYRVAGTSSTTADYEAELSTESIPTVVVPGTFAPGMIAFSTIGQTTVDTDIHLFDSTLTIIDDASNDDESVAEGGTGATTQSLLQRNLAPGTYYLAIGRFNTATNDNSPGSDDFRVGNVLDFADAIACSSTTLVVGGADYDLVITDSNGSVPVAVLGPPNTPFGIAFVELTVGAPPVTAYCFGDGAGTPCPCGNIGAAGRGCANSTGMGALLATSGSNSIGSADLVLQGSDLEPSQPGLYFQGDNAVNGGLGVAFGDGLRCAGGNVARLQIRTSNAGGQSATTIDIGTAGGVSPGDVKRYQLWYRNPNFPVGSPCGTGFNFTNGVEVNWIN